MKLEIETIAVLGCGVHRIITTDEQPRMLCNIPFNEESRAERNAVAEEMRRALEAGSFSWPNNHLESAKHAANT